MDYVDLFMNNGKVLRMKRKTAEHLAKRGKGSLLEPLPEPTASESVKSEAEKLGVNINDVEGSGKDGRILKRDIRGYQTRMLKAD